MELKPLTRADAFFLHPTTISQTITISCMLSDGQRIFLGSRNGTIRGWNLKSNKLEGTFADHKNLVNAMTLLNDGTMISVSDDCSMLQWSTRSYDKICKFVGPDKPLTCCTAIYDKEIAARLKIQQNDLVLFGGSWDHRIYIWSAVYVHPCRVLIKHTGPVKKIVSFEVKGEAFLASGCDKGEIMTWNLKTFTLVHRVQAHMETICDLKLYGKGIMSSSRDKKLKIWDENLELISEMEAGSIHVNRFMKFGERFLIAVRGVKVAEVWGKTTKKTIDKCQDSGIISEVATINKETIAVVRNHEVKMFTYVNVKNLAIRLSHKFRMETGYPPVVVKLITEAILDPSLY